MCGFMQKSLDYCFHLLIRIVRNIFFHNTYNVQTVRNKVPQRFADKSADPVSFCRPFINLRGYNNNIMRWAFYFFTPEKEGGHVLNRQTAAPNLAAVFNNVSST